MKSLTHPDYATLPILVAQSTTDKPQPGAFFVTAQTVPLSYIAAKAYGNGQITATQRINKSKYNMTHCIYRKSAQSCSSAKVEGGLALSAPKSFADWAWIALCQADKNGVGGLGYGVLLGTKYQVIWIPTEDGKEPWDIEVPVTEPKTPVGTIPGFNIKVPGGSVTIPGTSIHIGIGDETAPPPAEEETAPPVEEPKKAGMPWWLGALLGLGALTTVIVFAVRDKKKGKKRSKKAKGKR